MMCLINILNRKKSLLYILIWMVLNSLTAQTHSVDARFGINVIKPYSKGYNGKTNFSHNYWVGLNYRYKRSDYLAWNIGFQTNGVNYRFTGNDSPTVVFLTMNYLSVPVQIEFLSPKSKFSFLLGMEPKRTITGYENTAEPQASRKLSFDKNTQIYAVYNLGYRAGVSYRIKNLHYFLQFSSDMVPFKTYKKSSFTDMKVIFGFTILPFYRSKK